MGKTTNIQISHQSIPYGDPMQIFEHISQNGKRAHCGIFSGYETEDPSHPKKPSLLLKKAAYKVEALNQQVTITALTPLAQRHLSHFGRPNDKQVILKFPKSKRNIDEKTKLTEPSVFDALRKALTFLPDTQELPKQAASIIGVFSFDLMATFEDVGSVAHDPHQFNDFHFYIPEEMIIFNHQDKKAILTKLTDSPCSQDTLLDLEQMELTINKPDKKGFPLNTKIKVKRSINDQEYKAQVKQLKSHLLAGDIFQCVLARRFRLTCPDSLDVFKHLCATNPSPYQFYLNTGSHCLLGASPESYIKIEETVKGKEVTLHPIAGTVPRGQDVEEDSRLEAQLRLDPKEQSEHMMLVDLARNDLARICQTGTRHVTQLHQVERYSRVMHLVSFIKGILRKDLDPFHAYRACMNMGTLTGAPKVNATTLLRRLENEKRGPYGGAIGVITKSNEMDMAIIIRSALVHNQVAHVHSGAGIVVDSDPNKECAETHHKAHAVIHSILNCGE